MTPLPLVPAASAALAPTPEAIQVADTVLALPGRDGFDVIFGVTAGIIGLTFLAVLGALLILLLQTRKVAKAVDEARRRFAADRGVEHLRRAAENVEKLSRTIREEAEALRGSGAEVSERFTQVSDRMEERIDEFNALIEVMQEEAEELFMDTASTARGFRRGFGRLSDGRSRRRRPGRRTGRGGRDRYRERVGPAEPAPGTETEQAPTPGRASTPTPGAATPSPGASSPSPADAESLPDTQVTSPSPKRSGGGTADDPGAGERDS